MKRSSLVIIDYGMGNIASVLNAVEFISNEKCDITSSPEELKNYKGVILPGVGAFGKAMQNIKKAGLDKAIKEFIERDGFFLGICLGYQLLFEESEESPSVKGLGILKGKVVKFKDKNLKIPHIGWNNVTWEKDPPILKGISKGSFFYFVHSYYPVFKIPGSITLFTEYSNTKFASGLIYKKISAVQFHPEKSQKNGLILLKNFWRMCRDV